MIQGAGRCLYKQFYKGKVSRLYRQCYKVQGGACIGSTTRRHGCDYIVVLQRDRKASPQEVLKEDWEA